MIRMIKLKMQPHPICHSLSIGISATRMVAINREKVKLNLNLRLEEGDRHENHRKVSNVVR